MTQAEQIAAFSHTASYDQLDAHTRDQLRIRILDSFGCAIGALTGDVPERVRTYVQELTLDGGCMLIGGGRSRPDLAAFNNAALVRYLDFNDSYLAKGETCHPSDNLGSILAAGEYARASGTELMVALAVAYQVQCRLSDEAPVRGKGFDHTVQGAYAATAGIGRILGLTEQQLANAVAISATALNALRVTRTGILSNWKGLAYPHMAADCLRNALLARHGISGPLAVMEGEKGFMDAIAGHFQLNWAAEGLDRVTRTVLKKYNAEIHSQTSIEAALQLRREHQINADDIEHIDVTVFNVAYHIIGGGEEGDKSTAQTKEQADHSLPYLVAVALLDGQVMPEQYAPERIVQPDVQKLMKKVLIRASQAYSESFPDQMPSRVAITLRDGRVLEREIRSYPGWRGQPMSWDDVYAKFERLAAPCTSPGQRAEIADAVAHLERISVADLMALLAHVRVTQPKAA
ncbi:MAG: MmgE/PrpD family protein [Terriglobales bacterium]